MKNVLLILICVLGVFARDAFSVDVVRVRATRLTTGHGWGVALGTDLVLTSLHVLKDDGGIRATEIELDGAWVKVEVLRHDAGADLALLRVAGTRALKPAMIAKAAALVVYGSPKLLDGVKRSISPESSNVKVECKGLMMGISGAPVFNERDELHGMLLAQEAIGKVPVEGQGFMVTAETIGEFLKGKSDENKN